MIDLSFLTEAEQEAILKVLHRDAELKKAEEERVRQLQDAVDDENELKNKSGQWFYDAKSKRHRDTIHGADLVRASIRKRKKPSTIAELSEKQMDKKKTWVNSVKNVFIPPELYGVMEEPEEGLEDLQQTKEQINHSAKRVSFLSADNDKENLMNGAASPAKIRKNPFNAELDGIDTDFGKVQLPENGTDPPNTDKIPSYVKFGVKLPYPESKDTTQVSQSATNTKSQVPIPKPRTLKLKTNEQPPNGSSTSIKRDNSINGMGKRKGILKRCSSSSSTDSETVRIIQGIDVNKIALPGSPILEIRRHRSTDQDEESSENGQEQQKQVRFAANVLQRSPSPNPETFSGREFGEFRILEPMSSQNDLYNPPVDDHGSSEDSAKNPSSSLDLETIRDFYEDRLQKDQSFSSNTAPDLLEDILTEREKSSKTESPSEDPKLMKRVASQNDDSEPEPLYAVVKRIPKQDLPEDFDMEDIHMKPRVFGQEWKNPNVVSSGKPLEFGKSYGGGGKISYGTSYLNPQPQTNKVFSTERPAYTESYESGDKSWSETEDEPSYIDSVHSVIVHQRNVDLNTNRTENQPYVNNKKEFGSLTSEEEPKEPKFQSITFDANPDDLRFPDNQNKRNLEYFPREPKNQSTYKPVSINNVDGIGEYVPANLSSKNLARNDIVSDTRESLNSVFLNQLREKKDLPQSANFKVMSLKDRINDSTNEQISNPSQFQSLRSYWNVEEKNKDTEVSPNSILSGVLNRSKPVNSDPPQINFAEVTVDPEVPTNTVLNDFISINKPLRPALQSGSSAVVSPKVTEVSNTVFTDSARTRPIKSDSQQIYPTEITKDPSKNIEVSSKFLPRFQNKPAPITSEIPQREITDPLLLTDTYDSISEEDQTSQKVASWLAQSPNHYEEEQMYPSEEPAYPREEVVENVKKSVAPQKSNVEEFRSALEKLREEAFQTPNTEMDYLGATEEGKGFPTQDAEMHHHDLETLSEEDQASQKVSSWLERTPPNYDEEMYPSEEHLYPQEEIVENVQKTLAPQRSDKDEFSSALAKLQKEASFSTDEIVDHTEDINTFPKEEVGVNNMKTSETALPVKNLGKESYGNKARSGDISFFEKVKQISKSSENEAANTFIPRNTIDSDRVERHHPVKEAVQDFQPMNSGGTKINSNYAQEEVVVQKTLAPVNNANDAFKNALERLVKEHETLNTEDNSEYENSIEEEQSHVYEAMGVHKEEIIERTTLPTKQDLQEFTAALNRLEIEASETSHIPETSSSDHFEEPRSNLISSRESPVLEDTYHRRENIPYRSNEDQSDFSIQYSRATSTSEEEIENLNKDLYMTLKMLPDIKYSEAYPVHEETSIAESINTDELQRRLMQIHEDEDLNEHLKEKDVKPPNWDSEEPNDLVKDKVKVSEIPYKETLVSKKVYSDIESKPSLQDGSEPEPHDLTYPIARRPQDLYLASRSKSPLKNAGYGETGSYTRSPGNLPYKQPEIEPPEVSKPSSVETKQGKPAMVDDPSDNASSKPDKYTIEILKAKTESITKVLDWFSRSSETGEEEEIPPKKPEEFTNPTGESKDKPIMNIDSAQEALVLKAVTDNGQQKANGQMQTSSKSSVDSSKNSSAKSEHVLNVEIPKAVDVKVPPVASKVKLDPQNSNEEVAEQLVAGELKSGLDKMHPTVDHETGGEDVVITPENTEKEHLDISPKKIEDSKKENEPVMMSGEPGTSLVKVGVGETKVDSPVFLGQESGKKAATISRMPLILERSASLQQPIQTEQKKVREAILLGTGDTNVRALVKKLSKDSMSPVSPTEIPEKGNRVIPRKNSSDIFAFDSDDNSNGSLVAFKKVIVDDEDRTPNIAQLKSFWEKEKSEPETVRDNTRRNLPRRNIQSLIKHAASTPTLNEDLDTGKLSSTGLLGPGSMKHMLHYSFEKAQKNAPSYLRSVSLSEGINDNDDKLYKPLSFKSLRSFWNEGNITAPPAGKSTTISTKKSSIKFDVVKEQYPAVAKDDRSLLVRSEENLSKREPNKVIISSKFISIEKCNEEKTKTSNNLEESTKEKSQGNYTSSQSKAVDFSAKTQEKEPNKGIYSVQSSIVTNLPIVVTQQSNISLGHYDLPEPDALPVQERETTETSLVTQNPEDELFQTEMPNGTKVSEVSMSVLPKPSYEESTPDNVTSAEEPNVILPECTGDCVPSLHEPKVSYEKSTEDNVPRLKEQSQNSNKREVIEEVIEKTVAPKPKPRAFQAGLQNLFNEFVEDSPASGKPINNILPNPVYKPENVESEMQLDPGNVSIPQGYNLDNLITENNEDLYRVSDKPLEVKVPAATTPLIEPNISLNQDLSVKKKLDMPDPLAISGFELVHQSIVPQNMEITEFTLRLKKLQNEKAKDDSAQQELQALSSQSGPQESETLEKEVEDNQNEETRHPKVNETVEKTVIKRTNEFSTSLEKLAKESEAVVTPIPIAEMEDAYPQKASTSKYIFSEPEDEITEEISKTCVVPRVFNDFDAGLQKLYNESLDGTTPSFNVKAEKNEHMDENELEEESVKSRILEAASNKNESMIINRSPLLNTSQESASHNPMNISVSTKKMGALANKVSNGSPQQEMSNTSGSFAREKSEDVYKTVLPFKAEFDEINQNREYLIPVELSKTPLSVVVEVSKTAEETMVSQKPNDNLSISLENLQTPVEKIGNKENCHKHDAQNGSKDIHSNDADTTLEPRVTLDTPEQDVAKSIEKTVLPKSESLVKELKTLQKQEKVNEEDEYVESLMPSNPTTPNQLETEQNQRAKTESSLSEMLPTELKISTSEDSFFKKSDFVTSADTEKETENVSQKSNLKLNVALANPARNPKDYISLPEKVNNQQTAGENVMPKKQRRKEIEEKIEKPTILPRTRLNYFNEKLQELYKESVASEPIVLETTDLNEDQEEKPNEEAENGNQIHFSPITYSPHIKNIEGITDPQATINVNKIPHNGQNISDDVPHEVEEVIEKTVASSMTSSSFMKSLQKLEREAMEEEQGIGGSKTASIQLQLNPSLSVGAQYSHSEIPQPEAKALTIESSLPQEKNILVSEMAEAFPYDEKKSSSYEDQEEPTFGMDTTFESTKQSTPLKDRNSSLRRSTLELYLQTPYQREISKSMDFENAGYVTSQGKSQSLEDPVLKALKRTAAKTVPKDVQDIPPTDPNKEKPDIPNRDLSDVEVPSENLLVESQFSNPEKLKRLSQSVPVLLQDETDGRETDSASESSFQIGRHKKSPSSLTNLSGSSGMASLSSVSGSVMSVYSGDFGNIDIKGNIQFAVDYVEQLQEFHVFVSQCKDLAVADLKKQRSDPYVKSYLLPDKAKMGKRKTVVKKKSQNPSYNEVLRYKISKEALLTQTLNLSVWHNDALGRNSFLGEVDLGLATWDWNNKQMNWYPLQPRTPAAGIGLENRGDMKLALKYVPEALPGTNVPGTGEVHIQLKECKQLPMLRGNKINSFIKCTILPDTSRKSRQKTRAVDKTPNPIFNHTMVYDGFKTEDLKEACVELTVWDRNRLSNHFLGGLRIGLGTGKSYGTAVDWMDSSIEESTMWERMMNTPNTWIEGVLPLRMLRMAKLAK